MFRLQPNPGGSWTETILYSFKGAGHPYDAGPVIDATGNLYGTVSSGSADNGFVFEIIKNGIDHTFVMPVNGTLYLQQKGGSAGATTECGIGTSPANFVKYHSGLPNNPNPVGEVLVGTFTKGTVINFGMFTQLGSQSGWAFTDRIDSGFRCSLLRCRQQPGHGRQDPPKHHSHNLAAPSG